MSDVVTREDVLAAKAIVDMLADTGVEVEPWLQERAAMDPSQVKSRPPADVHALPEADGPAAASVLRPKVAPESETIKSSLGKLMRQGAAQKRARYGRGKVVSKAYYRAVRDQVVPTAGSRTESSVDPAQASRSSSQAS